MFACYGTYKSSSGMLTLWSWTTNTHLCWQLQADVAISVYEGTSNNIHLPLETSHPLVAVVMQAVQSDPGSENIKVRPS